MNDEEIAQKCGEIIDSLSECSLPDRYLILKTTFLSFLDICKEEGFVIEEMEITDDKITFRKI